ncbi:hypothetical protein MKEN_00440500 [Mycena kentingensis (nom. inval.)]|nr:hypothetical protein MKEN_00440500 [Mycena kentingensis (nom. inval.)]
MSFLATGSSQKVLDTRTAVFMVIRTQRAQCTLQRRRRRVFGRMVEEHPDVGPVRLMTGLPRVDGPGPSTMDIGTTYYNPQSVKHHRNRVLQPLKTRDKHLEAALEQFKAENPSWTVDVQWANGVQVVSLQSPFMRRCSAIRDANEPEGEAVGGVLTDSAYKYFRDGQLIVSSAFLWLLRSWIPVVLSYSNGGTAAHYCHHYLRFFFGIAEQCEEDKVAIVETLFAQVVDFSQAQRNGFIQAFTRYCRSFPEEQRSDDVIIKTAEALLKGCKRHFEEQINRVKRISRIVDPARQHLFANFAHRMLGAETIEDLLSVVADFIEVVPPCGGLDSLVDEAVHRADDIHLDTNAAEAMHDRLYDMLTRGNAVLPGLRGLVRAAEMFEKQYNAARRKVHLLWGAKVFYSHSEGVPVFYGQDRRTWRRIANIYGYTHHSRQTRPPAVQLEHDSRPPDTAQRLLKAQARGSTGDRAKTLVSASLSFLLLRAATSRGIKRLLSPLSPDNPLSWLLHLLELHLKHAVLTTALPVPNEELQQARIDFRQRLADSPLCKDVTSTVDQMNMAGFTPSRSSTTLRTDKPREQARALSLFQMFFIPLHKCYGGEGVHAHQHWEVQPPKFAHHIQTEEQSLRQHDAKLIKWFKALFDPNAWRPVSNCYRNNRAGPDCTGRCLRLRYFLHIPTILFIELGSTAGASPGWTIPEHLPVLPAKHFLALGLRYSLAGNIYSDEAAARRSGHVAHFIARYSLPDGKVFEYDGILRNGHAFHATRMDARWMSGATSKLPEVPQNFELFAVIYHLDGGEAAQTLFRQQRLKTAPWGLQFCPAEPGTETTSFVGQAAISDPAFISLTRAERSWVKPQSVAYLLQSREYRVDEAAAAARKTKPPKRLRTRDRQQSTRSRRRQLEDESSEDDGSFHSSQNDSGEISYGGDSEPGAGAGSEQPPIDDEPSWRELLVQAPPLAPVGSTGSDLELQGYAWRDNLCFSDTVLEVFFRAYVALPKQSREPFLRFVARDPVDDSALGRLLIHFNVRAVHSGIFQAPSSEDISHQQRHHLLTECLLDAQGQATRYMSDGRAWDHGGYRPGMPACARSLFSKIFSAETSEEVKANFTATYFVTYVCQANHRMDVPSAARGYVPQTIPADYLMAQKYLDQELGSVRLETYLEHEIPRVSGRMLHDSPPTSCANPDCDGTMRPTTVGTAWPPFLVFDPRFTRTDIAPSATPLACTLDLHINSQVDYELHARVLFHGEKNHYTAKIRFRNATYLYDDLHNSGLMQELGPLSMLADNDPATEYVLYVRVSRPEENITERPCHEINDDAEELPDVPYRGLEDDGELSTEVIQTLSHSVETHNQETLAARLQPSRLLMTPQRPYQQTRCDRSLARTQQYLSRQFGAMFATNTAPDGDKINNEVQCSECKYWSHIACLRTGLDYNDPAVEFICQECQGNGRIVQQIGLYPVILFPDARCPEKLPRFALDRKACWDALNMRGKLANNQVGKIRVPKYFQDEFDGHSNPALDELFRSFAPAIVDVLLQFDAAPSGEQHQLIQSFARAMQRIPLTEQAEEAGEWLGSLGLVGYAELDAVVNASSRRDLFNDARLEALPLAERERRIFGVGFALLRILAIQHDLNEPPSLTGTLLDDLRERRVVPTGRDKYAQAKDAMWSSTRMYMTSAQLEPAQTRFIKQHWEYDASFRPPAFARIDPASLPPQIQLDAAVRMSMKRRPSESDMPLVGKRARLQRRAAVVARENVQAQTHQRPRPARKRREPAEKVKKAGKRKKDGLPDDEDFGEDAPSSRFIQPYTGGRLVLSSYPDIIGGTGPLPPSFKAISTLAASATLSLAYSTASDLTLPLGPENSEEEEERRQRKKEKKAREREQKKARQAALLELDPDELAAAPHASTSLAYWNSRPAIHIATLQRSRSETPPPIPEYLPLLPSTPASTPSPSESSSTSRTSSKRPRTPDDDEDIVRIPQPPPQRKPRMSARKGWKGWVEGSPPPSEKLINLDSAPILQERRTRSGKNFDAIGVGKEGWV